MAKKKYPKEEKLPEEEEKKPEPEVPSAVRSGVDVNEGR